MDAEPRGTLFIISGPSGVGKTTVAKEVYRRLPWLRSSVTYTTRQKRRAAREDKVIVYVTQEEFQQRITGGQFLEWAVVHGHSYGTDRRSVEDVLAGGESILLNIDVQGTQTILETYPDAITIFIEPDNTAQLEARIRERKDISEDDVRLRLENIARELAFAPSYRYRVTNREGGVAATVDEVVHLVEQHTHD